jgi:uncharacterized membrane protein required for colicin V production
MNPIDLGLLVIAVLIFIVGYERGLFLEVFLLAKWAGAILFAWIFYKPVALSLQTLNIIPNFEGFFIDVSPFILIGYQIISFIGLWFIFRMIIGVMTFMFRVNRKFDEPKSWVRILGAVYGAFKAYVVLFIIALILSLPILYDRMGKNSLVVNFVFENTPIISNFVGPAVDDLNMIYNKIKNFEELTPETMSDAVIDLIEANIIPMETVVDTVLDQIPPDIRDNLFDENTVDIGKVDEILADPENLEAAREYVEDLQVSDELIDKFLQSIGVPEQKRIEILNKLK